MSLKSLSAGTRDLFLFNPEIIQIDPKYNIEGRGFDPANDDLDNQLVESIRENGIQTPLTVRFLNEQVVMVRGHRRLAAVKLLIGAGVDIKTVPCMSEARGTSDADRDIDLLISNDSGANGTKPISEIQRAAIFMRMVNHGWTDAQIAKKVACSEQTVRNQIAIHALPSAVKQMVEADEVSASEAVKVVRSEGETAPAVLNEALEIAKAEGKTKVTAKSLAKVETKAAAKKAAKAATKVVPGEVVAVSAAPDSLPPAVEDARANALASLDAMVKSLERLESDPKVHPRSRKAIESARVAVAEAFDITDQN